MADWDVTQTGQTARITTALGADNAFLESFTAVEALSEPFRITCQVLCPKHYSFLEHRGSGVSLEVVEGGDMIQRAFHGVLTEIELLEQADDGYRFEFTVRPWFWVLSLGRDCRIYLQKSARDIIKDVFEKAGVSTDQYSFSGLTDRGTIVREYCVQFEESDFAFVSRLMEEEGIYYYFAHTANQHVMTFCDASSAHTAFPHGDLVVGNPSEVLQTPHLASLTHHLRPNITEFAARDQHWAKFGDPLNAKSSVEQPKGTILPKFFEYPGGYAYLTDDGATSGTDFTSLRLQADEADAYVTTVFGDTFAVPVGASANVVWDTATANMLICGATHTLSGQRPGGLGEVEPTLTTAELDCVLLDQGWRPKRITPKPQARGPQVATVVGAQGEEIDCDKHGRVKVNFPWDRNSKDDGTGSCWVRVASSWAGPAMGESFLPRVGQEVLVTYIEGDMDRPVITGRVYDSTNVIWPTSSGGLPANKTQGGWKSQTVYGKSTEEYDGAVEPPSDEPGFNLLLFEDKSKNEKVFIRAQRDFWLTVFRDWKSRIHRDRLEKVGRHATLEVETGDETHTVTAGKRTTTINQDELLTVEKGNREMNIQTGNETLTVAQGNMATEVSMGNQDTAIKMGNQSTDVKLGNISIKADLGKIDIEAMQSITLKVGSSTVVVDQMGVTIKGMMIKTEAQIMHETKGLMTQVSGDAMLTLKGGITMIN